MPGWVNEAYRRLSKKIGFDGLEHRINETVGAIFDAVFRVGLHQIDL